MGDKTLAHTKEKKIATAQVTGQVTPTRPTEFIGWFRAVGRKIA